MKRLRMLSALLFGLAPCAAQAARPKPPSVQAPNEQLDPEWRTAPSEEDLQTLVLHLRHTITDPSDSGALIAGIDLFLNKLEKSLMRQGNDLPRDAILRNASSARESLRAAYTDLGDAAAPGGLPKSRDALRQIYDELLQLVEQNRGSVDTLEGVANGARSTASGMVTEPPESPGSPVPLDVAAGVRSLRPSLYPLRTRLKEIDKKLAQAKKSIRRAKSLSTKIDSLAEKAGDLDKNAVEFLSERRTRGTPAKYKVKLSSRDVILNANRWLKRAVQRAEGVSRMIQDQLDSEKDGLRKAIARALVADKKVMEARKTSIESGDRINFNHTKRLNGVIRQGYDNSTAQRRQWWVGRAGRAKGESEADAGKMDEDHEAAKEEAGTAESALRAALDSLDRLDQALGSSIGRVPEIDKRVLTVQAPRHPKGKPKTGARTKHKSKGIKIPHTLDVPDDEVLRSYDGGEDPPDGSDGADELPPE